MISVGWKRTMLLVGVAGWALAACSSGGGTSNRASSTTAAVTTTAPAAVTSTAAAAVTGRTAAPGSDEAIARRLLGSAPMDRFGWVRASAGSILAAYYPPGQRYLAGSLVPADHQILMVKGHGRFDHPHPAPPPGSPASFEPATLSLSFRDLTAGQDLSASQLWSGDAPDLGVGADPGLGDRAAAAARWDLRLVGTPTVIR